MLGDVRGKKVLELGSGAGANLAHLATLGAICTGIDLAPSRAVLARQTWRHLGGLEFVTADALDYLNDTSGTFDVIYSIFGAVWFTDPEALFPLVRERLSDGQVVRQWHLSVQQWTEQLAAAGFGEVVADTVDAPEPGKPGTVLISAA